MLWILFARALRGCCTPSVPLFLELRCCTAVRSLFMASIRLRLNVCVESTWGSTFQNTSPTRANPIGLESGVCVLLFVQAVPAAPLARVACHGYGCGMQRGLALLRLSEALCVCVWWWGGVSMVWFNLILVAAVNSSKKIAIRVDNFRNCEVHCVLESHATAGNPGAWVPAGPLPALWGVQQHIAHCNEGLAGHKHCIRFLVCRAQAVRQLCAGPSF